jgi:hypothetical protein
LYARDKARLKTGVMPELTLNFGPELPVFSFAEQIFTPLVRSVIGENSSSSRSADAKSDLQATSKIGA